MIRETAEDRRRQDIVAQLVATAWKCESGSLGDLTPIDVFFHRKKVFMAAAEIKVRVSVRFESRPDIYLDLDKWLSLMNVEVGNGKPSFFIVAFEDGIYALRIGTCRP